MALPSPNSEVFISNALSVGRCFLGLGCGGDFVPLRPGLPVYVLFPLAGPGLICGFATVAILPALVAPAVADSSISLIFMIYYLFRPDFMLAHQ